MILTFLCFLPGSVGPTQFVDLVQSEDLGFAPISVHSKALGANPVEFSAGAIARLREQRSIEDASVIGEAGCEFTATGIAGWPIQQLIWRTTSAPSEALIDRVSAWPGFTSALVGDSNDVFWQSANRVNTYEVYKRPWEHLPLAGTDVMGRPAIDISVNPGRREPAPGMWLWAASKMWFGLAAFMLLDRAKLLSLPVGDVTARRDGVVVVDLFEFDEPLETIREAQSAFRQWMEFDDLRDQADELRRSLSDPALEFETGSFDHGGVRLVTEWFRDGELTPRSRATGSRRTELNEDGSIAWQEDSTG